MRLYAKACTAVPPDAKLRDSALSVIRGRAQVDRRYVTDLLNVLIGEKLLNAARRRYMLLTASHTTTLAPECIQTTDDAVDLHYFRRSSIGPLSIPVVHGLRQDFCRYLDDLCSTSRLDREKWVDD